MESTVCSECASTHPAFCCQGCEDSGLTSKNRICKRCAQFADAADFELLMKMPAGLNAGAYCRACFQNQVQPALQAYQDIAERAKHVSIFEASQGKETRFIRRQEKPVQVTDCVDRLEAELRLAFLAAQSNFNALVDVDVRSAKFKTGGSYQKLTWRGTGVPVQIDPNKLKVRK